WKAPEPRETVVAPRSLREAAWLPFVGFLSRHRALAILSFLLLYKLADNLAQALQRPFLVDMGYSDFDRGGALATVGLFGSLFGLPRLVAGPICGFAVYSIGWYKFFWFTILAGIPGMIMLARFVPFGAREPVFTLDQPEVLSPLSRGQLLARGLAGTAVGS